MDLKRGAKKNRQWSIAIFCVLAVAVLPACGGKKEVKQVSVESKTSREAFAIAEGLRAAYSRREFSALQDFSTPDGYKAIINGLRHFDSVDLTFTPKWVEIEKSLVYLNVSWKGTWTVGGETSRERGMAVFLLEGRPLRLIKILRGSPFIYPER